jgi:phospholipid/cholesterol/gamma-HCH transport system substrate-binding protein
MTTRRPRIGELLTMVLFALSCFGLLVFLWSTFGGTVPLHAKGYRFHARFTDAITLTAQTDVRISGVSVGKVVKTSLRDGLTDAEIQVAPRYAPLPVATRAILRSKTLLGETFVELSAAPRRAPWVREGGAIPARQVQRQIQLDTVLGAFDPATRKDFSSWLTAWEAAMRDRAPDLSAALGNGPALAEQADGTLAVLDANRRALGAVISDGGEVLAVFGRRQRAVQNLLRDADTVFTTTARRDRALRATLRILPLFLRRLRGTADDLQHLTRELAPVITTLEPAAPMLGPALRSTISLAPQAQSLFRELGPVLRAADAGLPAASRTVRAARPLVAQVEPLARNLLPIAQYLALYKQEVTGSWAKLAAAFQAQTPAERPGGPPVHYARGLLPLGTENLIAAPRRSPTNRSSAYPLPRNFDKLASGADSFDCSNTGNRALLPSTFAPKPCALQPPVRFQGREHQYFVAPVQSGR